MPTNLESQFSLSTASNLYKIKYGKRSENLYNSATYLHGRVKKVHDFTGSERRFPAPLGFQGGRGAGVIPEYKEATYASVNYTAKKVYGVARYDRESIKAAMNNEGAFFKATAEVTQKTVEAYIDWMSIIMHGAGDGALGTITGTVTGTGTSGDPYLCTISDATWIGANWTVGDIVNVETGNTDKFLISAVNKTTKVVSLVAQAGASQVPASTDEIFMQGSEDAVPQGLSGVLSATSGTKYGVTIQSGWQSFRVNASSAGITTDLLNELILGIEENSGKTPDAILLPYIQYRKVLNQLEDQKRYSIEPRASNLKGKVSFSGVEFMSTSGAIPLVPDRYIHDTKVYAVNTDTLCMDHRPGFGWFDDDGTVFLRVSGEDKYEARYGGYSEFYIPPTWQGEIHTLAT